MIWIFVLLLCCFWLRILLCCLLCWFCLCDLVCLCYIFGDWVNYCGVEVTCVRFELCRRCKSANGICCCKMLLVFFWWSLMWWNLEIMFVLCLLMVFWVLWWYLNVEWLIADSFSRAFFCKIFCSRRRRLLECMLCFCCLMFVCCYRCDLLKVVFIVVFVCCEIVWWMKLRFITFSARSFGARVRASFCIVLVMILLCS